MNIAFCHRYGIHTDLYKQKIFKKTILGVTVKLIIKIIGYGLLGLIFLSVLGNFLMTHDSQNETQKSNDSKPNWSYSTDTVGIDKEQMSWISTKSANSLNLKFPYNGSNHGTLTIRKSKTGTELLFEITKGQVLCDLYACRGKIKFDSSPSISFSGRKPSDGTSNLIFLDNSNVLIQQIKSSKLISMQVEMFREGYQVLEFNVDGLNLKSIQ